MSTDLHSDLGHSIPRRGFLKIAIGLFNGLIAVLLAVPGLGYLLTPVFRKESSAWIELGAMDVFAAAQPKKATFKYISEAGYTRTEKAGFVWVVPNSDAASPPKVFSAVCSHTGCNVAWQPEDGQFVCPCHEGRYDIAGQVVSGPPPRPLNQLPTRVDNGQLLIQFSS
jgi:Rieske Fe-S protein